MHNLLKIREAAGQEAAALTRLAIRSKAHWGYSEAFMTACRKELTVTANHIASPTFCYRVGLIRSNIVGYYAIERRPEHRHELDALFVDPEWIGHGVGGLLLRHACNTALAMGAIGLQVQSDPNAEGFYQAAGGRFVGSRASGSIGGRQLPVFELPLNTHD